MENRVENGDYVVAIDLGTNTVVTVVGTKDEDGRIRIVDREVSPVQGMGMVRGEIKNIELVSQSIKATVAAIEQRQQIRITEAYAGVSGQHIRCVKHPYHVFSRGGEIRQEDVQHLHDSMRNVPAPEGEKILQIIPQSYVSTTRRKPRARWARSAPNSPRRSTFCWATRRRSAGSRWRSSAAESLRWACS